MTLRFAIRNLVRHARRSSLVLLTVAFGTGGLFAFHGFNAGIMNDYRVKVIRQQMGNGQLTTKGYRNQPHERPHELWIEDVEKIRTELKALPYVEDLYPRVRFPALVSAAGGKASLSALGEGVDGKREAAFFNALKLRAGKTLTDEDDGILLAKGLAESLQVKVGDRMTVLSQTVHGSINGLDARVVGIFFTGDASFDKSFFRIQLKAAQNLLETERAELLAVGLRDFAKWPAFAAEVARRFPALEAFSFEQIDRVNYENSVVWLDSQFSLFLIIFLSIIVLGVFNTTALGVLERTREIGIMRANGESAASVRRLFLLEGLILGIAGSCAGLGAVVVLNHTWLAQGILMPPPPGFEGYYYAFIQLQPRSAALWLGLGVVGTLGATWLAARRVNKLAVVEMLTHV